MLSSNMESSYKAAAAIGIAIGILKYRLFDLQRLHELQKILGFETQQLGGGGAISLRAGKSF